jgi:hypothetical protein
MTRKIFILANENVRERALEYVAHASLGQMVEIKPRTRSLDQNAMFHALCGDLAKSGLEWAGKARTASEWKVLLVSGHAIATNQSAEVVPGLEGEFINLRESTARMSKARASSLMDYALAFCAEHNIYTLHEEDFEA